MAALSMTVSERRCPEAPGTNVSCAAIRGRFGEAQSSNLKRFGGNANRDDAWLEGAPGDAQRRRAGF
jgi:hypothetical protein